MRGTGLFLFEFIIKELDFLQIGIPIDLFDGIIKHNNYIFFNSWFYLYLFEQIMKDFLVDSIQKLHTFVKKVLIVVIFLFDKLLRTIFFDQQFQYPKLTIIIQDIV